MSELMDRFDARMAEKAVDPIKIANDSAERIESRIMSAATTLAALLSKKSDKAPDAYRVKRDISIPGFGDVTIFVSDDGGLICMTEADNG